MTSGRLLLSCSGTAGRARARPAGRVPVAKGAAWSPSGPPAPRCSPPPRCGATGAHAQSGQSSITKWSSIGCRAERGLIRARATRSCTSCPPAPPPPLSLWLSPADRTPIGAAQVLPRSQAAARAAPASRCGFRFRAPLTEHAQADSSEGGAGDRQLLLATVWMDWPALVWCAAWCTSSRWTTWRAPATLLGMTVVFEPAGIGLRPAPVARRQPALGRPSTHHQGADRTGAPKYDNPTCGTPTTQERLLYQPSLRPRWSHSSAA